MRRFSRVGRQGVQRFTAPLVIIVILCPIVLFVGCRKSLSSIELLERGILLAQRERFVEALQNFNDSLALESGNPDTHYERAVVYERLGKNALALADYDEAIRIDPEFLMAYNNRGILHASENRNEAAIADFTRMLQIDPGYVAAFQMRAEAFEQIGRLEKAIGDLDQAINLQPNAEALVYRGALLTQLGRMDEALVDLNEAIENRPEFARAYLNRSLALAVTGKSGQARADLERAAALEAGLSLPKMVEVLKSLVANQVSERGVDASSQMDAGRIEQLLKDLGWQHAANDSKAFPYLIRNAKGADVRCLCLALLDAEGQGITISGEMFSEILREQRPKSLLVQVSKGHDESRWQFIENWQPSREDTTDIRVRLSIRTRDREILVKEALARTP